MLDAERALVVLHCPTKKGQGTSEVAPPPLCSGPSEPPLAMSAMTAPATDRSPTTPGPTPAAETRRCDGCDVDFRPARP
jgi:hypothetical protein